MREYLVKRYSIHTGISTSAKESSARLQTDMNELAKENWRVISMIDLHREGTVTTLMVTYER